MPRPRMKRNVCHGLNARFFKPVGVPIKELDSVNLTPSELESLRLKNIENLDQDECAKKMKISQSTFHRILLSARQKVSDALVNGKAIKIDEEE